MDCEIIRQTHVINMPLMILKMMQCLKRVKIQTITVVIISVIIAMKILGDSVFSKNYRAVILFN
jgi:hypothetical protein